MAKMKELAYRRPVWKEITHIMGTDNKVCVEYTSIADTSQPLTDVVKERGTYGIDLAQANAPFELKVCFVYPIKDSKIDRAREYWDAAAITRQFGMSAPVHS
jgi:ketosteroid isomerase-like protein